METTSKTGYLYVLSNESMNDMVKIGRTNREPEIRTQELSSATGVPTSFNLEYSKQFSDSIRAERLVHKYLELNGKRLSDKREFFQVSVEEAVELIDYIESKYFNSDKEPARTDHYMSKFEKDEHGNDIKIQIMAESTSMENDFYRLTKTITYADDTQDIDTYLTNDLSAFFVDPSGPPEPLSHTEQLIDDLIWKANDLMSGYGSDGIIDINGALNLYEEAAQLGSADAYYELGDYYLHKYIEDSSDDRSRLKARHYFSQGAKLPGKTALRCISWLTNGYLYSISDEGLDRYIISNNTLSYWRMYFEKLKELDGKYTLSYDSIILELIDKLFLNIGYINSVNEDSKLRDPYSRAIEEGLDVLKYRYYDLIREINKSGYIARYGKEKQNKHIRFLEDTFNIKSSEVKEENDFKGSQIDLVSYEKGNYMVTGKLNGKLNENDMISLKIFPYSPFYFKIRNIEKDLENNTDLLFIEGIHPDFPYLASRIENSKDSNDNQYPIEINKSGSLKKPDMSVDDIVNYLLDKRFQKSEERSTVLKSKSQDSDKSILTDSQISNTSKNQDVKYSDSTVQKDNRIDGKSNPRQKESLPVKKNNKQNESLLSQFKKWFNKLSQN